jgi:hypothetical protein
LLDFFQSGGSESSVNAINSQASANQTFLVQPAAIEAAANASAPKDPSSSRTFGRTLPAPLKSRNKLVGIASAISLFAVVALTSLVLFKSGSDKPKSSQQSEIQWPKSSASSAPTVKTTLVPPTTTTEPLPPGCYTVRNVIGGRSEGSWVVCEVLRASRTKELNFLSSVRVIVGLEIYNGGRNSYQTAEEYWLDFGYLICDTLNATGSYDSLTAILVDEIAFELELIFVAAIQTLCPQLTDLIP